MEESTRQKPRILPSMFRPSFASCSSRALFDVIEKSILLPSRNFHRFPSMCRPVTPLEPTRRTGPISTPKVPVDSTPAGHTLRDVLKGRACPTVPAVSPQNHPFRKLNNQNKHDKCEAAVEGQWLSSDDEREEEDETDTIFSSKSLSSSDSSQSHQQRIAHRKRRSQSDVGILLMDNDDRNNIRGSFAVVKKSSDPYGDFRQSMVEMIIEKQMFGAKELERLLQCFLSLNSHHHHKVIVEVFSEIWEALFPHWS